MISISRSAEFCVWKWAKITVMPHNFLCVKLSDKFFFVSGVTNCRKINPCVKMSDNSPDVYRNDWEKFGIVKFWKACWIHRVQFNESLKYFFHGLILIPTFSDVFILLIIFWHFSKWFYPEPKITKNQFYGICGNNTVSNFTN